MNPFDLPGPQFLLFYLALGAAVLILVRLGMNRAEIPPEGKLNLTDPYEIAMLRGGKFEAMRVAALSLVDRGLLKVAGDNLAPKTGKAAPPVRRPMEAAMLKSFSKAAPAIGMFTDSSLLAECGKYEEGLSERRLLAGSRESSLRWPYLFLGLAVLLGTGSIKLNIALSRGKTNVGYLICMGIAYILILLWLYRKRTTQAGDRAIADLKTLFRGLKNRAYLLKKGGDTNEAALLAAVFGLSALSSSQFSFVRQLFPKASGSTSSCGTTSCGSSSGSSCGGGGGGCGGCGGGD